MILPVRSDAFPRMAAVRQELYSAPLGPGGAVEEVRREVAAIDLSERIRPGMSVAVGCGSRGIDQYAAVVKAIVREIAGLGARPFIFPAMGSHGGATPEGQRRVLETLGVSESYVGCPIRSTMDVITLGATPHGLPVYLDQFAAAADAIVIVNRVKPHTNFHGPLESGLMKMLAIGAGKQRQASAIHRLGVPGLRDEMPEVARVVLQKAPVAAGFALVEDARHQLSRIVGVRAEAMEETEARLLDEIRGYQPKLPVGQIDLLVVDRIGKDLSGTGMDPNVIGRCRLVDFVAFPEPVIKVITVHDLSEKTHGNAIGVGMADITTRRVADKFDPTSTYANSLTGFSPAMGAIPIVAETDREAIRLALDYLIGAIEPERARVVRIRDTLNLEWLEASEPVLEEIRALPSIQVRGPARAMAFDAGGAFAPPAS
ncbi:MAG: lactate racemase domain-containing protein [Thermoguttaceae bacterium]